MDNKTLIELSSKISTTENRLTKLETSMQHLVVSIDRLVDKLDRNFQEDNHINKNLALLEQHVIQNEKTGLRAHQRIDEIDKKEKKVLYSIFSAVALALLGLVIQAPNLVKTEKVEVLKWYKLLFH